MSATIRARNSSAVEGLGSFPIVRSRSTMAGSCRICTSSVFKRLTIAARKTGRPDNCLPGSHDVPGNAGFGHCRGLRQAGEASAAGHREGPQPAVPNEFQQRARRIHHEIEALADEIDDRGRAATIGHVLEPDVGGFSEKLDCQVRARSVAGGAIEQRCASGTSGADQVFDRSDRIVGVRHHDVGILGGHAYRREIIHRPIGKALESGRHERRARREWQTACTRSARRGRPELRPLCPTLPACLRR